MPTVGIKKTLFDKCMGKIFSEIELDELCFEYGLELDEIVSETFTNADGSQVSEFVYKIEVPANRYDLLCLEGLVRSLKIFQKQIKSPHFAVVDNASKCSITVTSKTKDIRPFVVAAILRDVSMTPDVYATVIDLQEKLHQNVCRKRTLVAIGVHDLDAVCGPSFVYTAEAPADIKFVALNQTKMYTAKELMELYSTDSHLKQYLHIIKDKPAFPVIRDSNGNVLSMPPIINGDLSKVTQNTKNLFIECTGTDYTKCNIVLNTLVTMFSEHCRVPFTVETVDIKQTDGSVVTVPDLSYHQQVVSVQHINKQIGVELSSEAVQELLARMGLTSEKTSAAELSIQIPPTRRDIMHVADIVEDVAIAFGYNNIKERIPDAYTVAREFPLNKLTDAIRAEMAMAGFVEGLTFALCSRDDISSKLRHADGTNFAVHVTNPKTSEFQVARTSLLPGLLKTISHNRNMPLPLKLFEAQDVVLKSPETDVGSRNERRLCAVYYGKSAGLEIIHGLLDRVMQLFEVKPAEDGSGYYLEADTDPKFFSGSCAKLLIGKERKVVGRFGTLHPDVLSSFELKLPCAALELGIEMFV